jgi:hypothetical protein
MKQQSRIAFEMWLRQQLEKIRRERKQKPRRSAWQWIKGLFGG